MPSSFESVLHSNYTPSEQECALNNERLTELQQELAALQERLKGENVDRNLPPSQMRHEMAELLSSIDAHRALLSPIRRLPDEILREIFVHTLPSRHNATLSARGSPLILRHVCLRWRNIAVSTPRLWSSLHIPVPSSPAVQESLLESWINLSGALPLSLSFSSVKDPSESTLPDLKAWYKRLAPFQSRLRGVEVTLQGDLEENIVEFTDEIQRLSLCPLSHVSKLVLHIIVGDSSFMDGAPLVFQNLALHRNSRLRELDMACNFHILTLPQVFLDSIPWANLTGLDLQTRNTGHSFRAIVRTGVLLNIIHHAPNLVSLKAFAAGRVTEQDTQNLPDVVLSSRLRHVSLALLNFSQLSTVELLAKCDWPTLTSLHLGSQGDNGGTRERSYTLERVISKFVNALTSLRFSYQSFPPDHLVHFLSLIRNLVQVHIDSGTTRGWYNLASGCACSEEESDSDDDYEDGVDGGGKDELLISLTPMAATQGKYSCPLLRYFRWEGHTPFSDAAVKDFLIARASPSLSPVPLKQVVIKFDRDIQEDIALACAQPIRAGLKLHLVYSTGCSSATEAPNAYRDLYVEEDPFEWGWEV